ncbi:MAG: hypothetical protein AB7O67_02780 [Vicinamibacterales bacterium]
MTLPPDPSGKAPAAAGTTAPAFVEDRALQVAAVSDRLRSLAACLADGPIAGVDLCAATGCSRSQAYAAAIRHTIAVLARTRGSFKSRELAELRRGLEALLEGGQWV